MAEINLFFWETKLKISPKKLNVYLTHFLNLNKIYISLKKPFGSGLSNSYPRSAIL